ncbi:MAG: hypothetical protein KDC38_14530, partial [Planctomycetes bacterium]|nr:hypothetical protein [Planctomycetota bacterium]
SVNGRAIAKEKMRKDAIAYQRFSFASSKGKSPALQSLILKGELHPDLPLMVANRGGHAQGKLPQWKQQFEAATERVKILCSTSQEDADRWAKGVDAVVARFFAIFPAPTGWKQTSTVYVFRSPEVLRAYSGNAQPHSLERGKAALAIVEEKDDTIGTMGGLVIGENLKRLSSALPEWWETGLVQYHRELRIEGETFTVAPLPADVKSKARQGFDEIGKSGFLDYLQEKQMVRESGALAHAWVHFLLEADGGAHRPILVALYEALRQGKPTDQAVAETIPADALEKLLTGFVSSLSS